MSGLRMLKAWLPAGLILLWLLGRWLAPQPAWLWVALSLAPALIGIARVGQRQRLTDEGASPRVTRLLGRSVAALAASEPSLSLPLLLTAITLFGAFGNVLESSNIPLLVSLVAWLAFTACMVILLEPAPVAASAAREGLPEPTAGLVLFMSRRPPGGQGLEAWKQFRRASQEGELPDLAALSDQLQEVLPVVRTHPSERTLEQAARLEQSHPWVVLLAGTPLGPAFCALMHHRARLAHLWTIYTDESVEVLELLGVILERLGLRQLLRGEIRLANPESVIAIQTVVDEAYRRAADLGLADHQVTTDVTGGSGLMSIGGALACVKGRRQVEYLNQTTYRLQAVPVGFDNVADAFQEFANQLMAAASRPPGVLSRQPAGGGEQGGVATEAAIE